MDSEEEEEGDSVLEGALPPGPMWEEEEEDCLAALISSAELPQHLFRRGISLTVALRLCLTMEGQLTLEPCPIMTILMLACQPEQALMLRR